MPILFWARNYYYKLKRRKFFNGKFFRRVTKKRHWGFKLIVGHYDLFQKWRLCGHCGLRSYFFSLKTLQCSIDLTMLSVSNTESDVWTTAGQAKISTKVRKLLLGYLLCIYIVLKRKTLYTFFHSFFLNRYNLWALWKSAISLTRFVNFTEQGNFLRDGEGQSGGVGRASLLLKAQPT